MCVLSVLQGGEKCINNIYLQVIFPMNCIAHITYTHNNRLVLVVEVIKTQLVYT